MNAPPPTGARDEPAADPLVQRMVKRLDALADRPGAPRSGTAEAGPDADADADAADRYASAVAAQLGEASTWIGPPAELRAAVLARALGSSEEGATAPHLVSAAAARSARTAGPAGRVPAPVRRLPPRWRRLTWAVPVAAAAAVVFTFGVIAVDRAVLDDAGPGQTYVAAGTPLSPGASARITVAVAAGGFSIVLDTHDLPPAAPGSYYAAWLNNGRVSVPLGSFHARRSGGPIKLWSGVDPRLYPHFTVTLQTEGQPPLPPGQRYLTATVG